MTRSAGRTLLSDTHSRYATVEKMLQLLQDRNINLVLHCV
jgi:predicted phosphodiesterase